MTDSLFEQVFATPDDDGPRVVLADHLCELGDPRGEFISIQLAEPHGATGLAKGRAKQLKRHYDAWLPPGVQRSTALFRRGFLHACRWMAPTDPTHREWRMVERLECGNVNGVASFPRDGLFSGAVLPRLKELGGADPSVFATLCQSDLRSRLEILRTFYLPFEQLAGRVGALAQFAPLQTLDLEGTELPAEGLLLVLRNVGALKRLRVDDLGARLPLRGVRGAIPPGLTLSIHVERERLCWFEFFGDEVRLCHRRSASAYMRSHLLERARREGLTAALVAVEDLG